MSETTTVKMTKQVVVNGKKETRTTEARKPSTITELKAQGWKPVEDDTNDQADPKPGTRAALAAEARDLGLDDSGTKAELQARLDEHNTDADDVPGELGEVD